MPWLSERSCAEIACGDILSASYQLHVLITALVAYRNRTGADMTEWFGLHELPTKKKRHLALAA